MKVKYRVGGLPITAVAYTFDSLPTALRRLLAGLVLDRERKQAHAAV